MDLVAGHNNESRSTHNWSTLKWLRSRILFIIGEWAHGSKLIAAMQRLWLKANCESESVATNCAVYIDAFCFSPSSFSLFSYVFNSIFIFCTFFSLKNFSFRFFAFLVMFALWKCFILQINIYVEVYSMCLIACWCTMLSLCFFISNLTTIIFIILLLPSFFQFCLFFFLNL